MLASDGELHALLARDPELGWRAFVDAYTPLLLDLIARAGVAGRDEVTDVYLLACERLAENGCARLRKHDPGKGALAAWLTILVRHFVVDWVRSRAGRRRLFRAIQKLDGFDQRVFERYYWEHRRPAEIAELLAVERRRPVGLADVLAALQRIHDAMTDRHRSQLLALVARTRRAASLDSGELPGSLVAAEGDPERALSVRELDALFSEALTALPAEDAAIVRLTFVQGWSREEVKRALHLERLPSERLAAIIDRLRAWLSERRLGPAEAATPGLRFLEGGQ